MSTPISGSSGTGLLNALLSPGASSHAGNARSSQSGALADAGMPTADTLAAALQAAAASVNQLAQVFVQALQGTTSVDPSTGLREVSASASSQLNAALSSFLVQSGFSQQQADAAASGFAAQLATGGPVNLDASFDETSAVASSMSATYGATTMSASSVAVNERAGSVSIAFEPTSGKVSISLQEQQISAVTSVTQISSANPLPPLQLMLLPQTQPLGILNLLPSDSHGHDTSGDSNGDSNGASNGQDLAGRSGGSSEADAANAPTNATPTDTAATTDANSVLSGLIAGLGQPTLHSTQDALDQLARMAEAAQQNAAAAGDDNPDGPQDPSAAAVTIGFTQTLSISLLDLNGHGTTLFKRPDGSTGAMSFEPTHVEA
jgi:hypothetical protein